MDRLEQGGTSVCRELLSGISKRTPANGTIDVLLSSQPRQEAERVEVGQHSNQLFVPRTSNYTAIDAWVTQYGGFQIKMHGISKGGVADDLAKLGSNVNRLFFLLPPLFYKAFTKRTPQTIERFAILVPYAKLVQSTSLISASLSMPTKTLPSEQFVIGSASLKKNIMISINI
ncbi:uncharacterized protein PHALS_08147 [Plasmopara halstedii]|uniref:Uncharacterized protein n=1 Tax=Plasmopara halstedii TaxID=4781 RepID=A0A0P1B6H1_PLAHL|nr:uncharacterized protein PHALS_08147 [Plasmopara halstedii]CEG50436.1 hypothetical protein PHALS_08147 [Plasmopara halstedii]|eukprot:XP_024586805.1 hypothetical protein PHALS_08147 [Plasmopara halstedii]